jgi:hypothetical protein
MRKSRAERAKGEWRKEEKEKRIERDENRRDEEIK